MLTNWHTILEIALRTTAVYALVLVGIRLTGKREVGQMTPFDLTLLLLLSNSVQNAMTGPDTSLMGGATAALVLLTLNFLLAEVSGLNRGFRKMIQGSPTLLIHSGECVAAHMAKEHISNGRTQPRPARTRGRMHWRCRAGGVGSGWFNQCPEI
jgi:uncharacterized membrane protein YcaP (DUF421 family)